MKANVPSYQLDVEIRQLFAINLKGKTYCSVICQCCEFVHLYRATELRLKLREQGDIVMSATNQAIGLEKVYIKMCFDDILY